jgi:hypothetical protein
MIRNCLVFLSMLFMIFSFGCAEVRGYNEYAPNSFDTVSMSSKEYKAVYEFCRQGKAPAYSVSFFAERPNLTRYELAGVIKNLLESGLVTDQRDQAVLNQLKKNYSRELSALGWKEKRQAPPHGHAIYQIQRNGDVKTIQ